MRPRAVWRGFRLDGLLVGDPLGDPDQPADVAVLVPPGHLRGEVPRVVGGDVLLLVQDRFPALDHPHVVLVGATAVLAVVDFYVGLPDDVVAVVRGDRHRVLVDLLAFHEVPAHAQVASLLVLDVEVGWDLVEQGVKQRTPPFQFRLSAASLGDVPARADVAVSDGRDRVLDPHCRPVRSHELRLALELASLTDVRHEITERSPVGVDDVLVAAEQFVRFVPVQVGVGLVNVLVVAVAVYEGDGSRGGVDRRQQPPTVGDGSFVLDHVLAGLGQPLGSAVVPVGRDVRRDGSRDGCPRDRLRPRRRCQHDREGRGFLVDRRSQSDPGRLVEFVLADETVVGPLFDPVDRCLGVRDYVDPATVDLRGELLGIPLLVADVEDPGPVGTPAHSSA